MSDLPLELQEALDQDVNAWVKEQLEMRLEQKEQ